MKNKLALTALVMFAGAGFAHAADGELSLGVGLNYSTGTYGTPTSTDILSIPLMARYERDRWLFKLSVPWLEVSGGVSVIPGIGSTSNSNSRNRGRSTTTTGSASGLGDVVAAATYTAAYDSALKRGVDLTGRVKLGTADRDQGLGTGTTDVGFQVDVYQSFDRLTPFAGIGYTHFGDSPFIQLNDALNATAGAAYRLNERDSAGGSLDLRERVTPSGAPQRELTAFWSRKLDRIWKAQLYVLKGFSDGSPDWGAGASVLRAF